MGLRSRGEFNVLPWDGASVPSSRTWRFNSKAGSMQRRLGKVPPVHFVEGNVTPEGASWREGSWLALHQQKPAPARG